MLPAMYGRSLDRDGIDVFRGINKSPRIAENEFADMKNMSGEEYPCITTRQPRGVLRSIKKPNGMIANGALAWVDGSTFWYNNTPTNVIVSDGPKTMVNMGAYIVIFPDKVRYNTVKNEWDYLGNTYEGGAEAEICTLSGDPYAYETTKPSAPTDGQYYLDTEANALYVFSAALDQWQSVPTVYVKVSAANIGAGFKANDGVTFSGLGALDGTHVIRKVAADNSFVVITGIIPQKISATSGVTLTRKVPNLDYVCEQNNRLWGCRYGQQGDAYVNEIYACALGDPTNWHQFDGTSMDSYTVNLGSAGAFTGMTSHLGYVMAFKEEVIHKLYGNYPANFQVADTRARGVALGSSKSIAITQEQLIYLSPTDVCVMGTGLPSGASDALSAMDLRNGVGGIYERKYYLGCKDRDGNNHLLVYDTDNNIWYREDDIEVLYAASCDGDLYLIANATINKKRGCYLFSVSGNKDRYSDGGGDDGVMSTEDVNGWSLESGLIGLKYPEHKYISQIMIRLEALDDATISCDVMYDNEDEWRNVYEQSVKKKDNVRISVRPRHCDTMRYRLSGTGKVRLYSIVKHTETAEEW